MPIIQSNGINFAYEETGSGDSVICIMGITAPGAVWGAHTPAWESDFRCITPDNRGVGESDKPEGPYSSEMMATDYIGLMDELGIESAHVIGCSMGSIIAQQIALLAPEKVKSLVLMCSWSRCDNYAKHTFEHLVNIKAALPASQFMHYIQQLIFTKPFFDNEECYASFAEGQAEADADPNPQPLHGLAAQAEACKNHNVYDRLGEITAPTLVIGGEDDIFTPRWMAEEIHAKLPNSKLYLYKDAGHAFHFEYMEDFNARILEWLKKQ